jgi:hypothetical protein
VTDRVGRVGEWEGPVDDRGDVSGFDEIGEAFEVFGVFACDEGGEPLAGDERGELGADLAVGAAEPAAAVLAADDDECAGGCEGAAEVAEAAVAAGVDDDVVAAALGERVVAAVVDDPAGAEPADEVDLVAAGDAGDDAAEQAAIWTA